MKAAMITNHSINLTKSFNKFKNTIMEQVNNPFFYPENISYADSYYNSGIQRCIDFCKQQEQMYKSIDPEGLLPTAMAIEAIYKSFE